MSSTLTVRRARITFRNAKYQLGPHSLAGGALTYWGAWLALAGSAVLCLSGALG